MQTFFKKQTETKQGKVMIIIFLNDKLNVLLRLKFIQKIALLFTKKIVNTCVHAGIHTLS